MAAFTTLILTERDFNSPINEDVVDALHDRDEDLRERPCYLEMALFQSTVTSYAGSPDKSWQIYVPETGNQLKVAFQMRIQDATTGEVECRIGGLTSDEQSTSNTAYVTEPVFWCTFTDLSTINGTEVQLDLYAKYSTATGGTPWVRVREADGPVSYFLA